MILPDLNLLLYAHDARSAFHPRAREWWQDRLSGAEETTLVPVVLFGFLRLSTSRVFARPLTPHEAAELVRSWLRRPQVRLRGISDGTAEGAMRLLEALGTAGNLVTDAQITALALQHKAIVHTADADFARFPGVRWFNPITGQGGR